MHADALPILDQPGRVLHADDRRQAVFPRDHGAMGHQPTHLGHQALDRHEQRRPARVREGGDQDIPRFQFGIGHVREDAGAPWRVRTVIKGDQSCIAVAAASVIAKVRRDTLMAELGLEYADFDFAANAGYPSPTHRTALEEHGPTPYHRVSWSYMDALPRWRHLKKVRVTPEASALEAGGQLGFDF